MLWRLMISSNSARLRHRQAPRLGCYAAGVDAELAPHVHKVVVFTTIR